MVVYFINLFKYVIKYSMTNMKCFIVDGFQQLTYDLMHTVKRMSLFSVFRCINIMDCEVKVGKKKKRAPLTQKETAHAYSSVV